MARHPDLTIRIDVEHEIVNPVAENYDIVFAMLETPLPSTGIVIRRMFTVERGLFAAPSLMERHGEPRTLEDLAKLPLLAGPSDAAWPITPPGGKAEHLSVEKARLVSSNAHIRLQAALAGHGVLRVTASFTRAAVEAGSLKRLVPDHVCEPLSVHALLPDAPVRAGQGPRIPGRAGSPCPCRGRQRWRSLWPLSAPAAIFCADFREPVSRLPHPTPNTMKRWS